MSSRSSPLNGGYDAAEPAVRLSVRKDLFPQDGLSDAASDSDSEPLQEDFDRVSCVKLETDFEQSIDEIAHQKMKVINGALPSAPRSRHKKHKQHSKRDKDSPPNGCPPKEKKKKKKSHESHKRTHSSNSVVSQVKGGKNLNLVSSSECQEEELAECEDESETSEDEVLHSMKLPIINISRQSGKPYSHELSQLSSKKSKNKDSSKEQRTHIVIPSSGKPRSMLGLCSSRSKKKSKKTERAAVYRSQIVDSNTKLKIKIRRTREQDTVVPTPKLISDLGQRKSKKKRAYSPAPSNSSGEEYDPTKGDTAASISVAAPKPRHSQPKTRKSNNNNPKSKDKAQKTEKSRVNVEQAKDIGPQSPWANALPEEVLARIFDYATQAGSLPTIVRLSRVCRLWYNVSCRPEFWKHMDLAQYAIEKFKTDYKLVWILENRLSQCQVLNIAQWKVSNVSWVLACVADYCPGLVELSVAGWSRITSEQLYELMQGLPALQRLDLSLTSETGGSSTCLSAASMARVAAAFGARLTHLILANNKFTALTQILTSVATHCANLEVLDISGALAISHPAPIPLEALQKGCPKLRVFRAANSQLVLASATTSQQMESGGWSQLEELSIAGNATVEREALGEYRFGDEALARLVRAATRLRLLDLRNLQRLTDSGLVRVPAWDLQHLFLGGCNVTRQNNACLELICEKWSHSLLELDLSWASAAKVLDDAVSALADSPNSKLRILNLCGSSVSFEAVKKVLLKCPHLESINLSSCRALPRGIKRLFTGTDLQNLKDSLDPEKEAKAKEEETKKKKSKKTEASKPASSESDSVSTAAETSKLENTPPIKSPETVFQEPKSVSDSSMLLDKVSPAEAKLKSPTAKSETAGSETLPTSVERKHSSRGSTPNLSSPLAQSKPDSSSTPSSDPFKTDFGSPHFSPVQKPDSQVPHSPGVASEPMKTSPWSLGSFKRTPTHKSEASPLNRLEGPTKLKHGKVVEQCSPTTSLENKPSPETLGVKQKEQDIKHPNNWSYARQESSPMRRQEAQFASQRSPYSAQPSPAQPSPYSTQPSPYSTQPSPYSSQPSPYSAQPSPDTSQIAKPELQKTGWNTGGYSPMRKHPAPFSPHPATLASPDPGLGLKVDGVIMSNPNKTPVQYSPMSRPQHPSPYSPRPGVDPGYVARRSPGVGGYSPMVRPDCHLPSPDAAPPRPPARQDAYGRTMALKMPEGPPTAPPPEIPGWGADRFGQMSAATAQSIESLVWSELEAGMLNTPPPQPWSQSPFDGGPRRAPDAGDPWTLSQFRMEPPTPDQHTFVEQNVSFESLSTHLSHQHALQSYLDDNFSETSRVD
ncbi:uncharacterized protein LOC121729330 [Aricia agestis]|uniref:uncharacterized protein LOC121729330 n=1 Tax=Aricia agestis TaxID=91739 RepID=UPI001C2041B0|nr:uncharacterized protein LOC121729330 [Aricia agestis]